MKSHSLHDPPSGMASGSLRAIHRDPLHWRERIASILHRRRELHDAPVLGAHYLAAVKESA